MTISEPIEEAGFFWLPDTPERCVPGFLRVSEWGAITLETISLSQLVVGRRSFGDPGIGGDPINFERIVGVTKIGAVTLDDCSERSYSTHLGGGLSTSVLGVNRLFVGVGYGRDSEVVFSELRFSVRGLDEWLRISGIEVIHHEDKNVSVHFSHPEPVRLKISDEIALEFNFSGQVPTGFNIKEARIAQKAYISLTSQKERPLDDFLSLVHKIRDFFSFVFSEITYIDSLTGYSDEIIKRGRNADRKEPVRIHFRSSPRADALSKDASYEMLFIFSDVKEGIEIAFTKWVDAYNSHGSIFRRYFFLSLDNTIDLERRFCFLVEGMAAIHKKSYESKATLLERLVDIMKPFQRFFGTDSEVNAFVRKVIKMRNYLIHLHDEGRDANGNVDNLFSLNCRLEALFQLHLLHTIGIEDSHLDRIVENNRHLRGNLEQKTRAC